MIHSENFKRTLLTPYILSRELARLRGFDQPWDVHGEAEGVGDCGVRFTLQCGAAKPDVIDCSAADLLMSLEEFSAKYIRLVV